MLMLTLRVVITLGFLAGLCADLIPQGAEPATSLYVNVETGDDVNPGSASAPFKTLNKALQQAYDLRNPPPGTPLVLIERVFIQYSDPAQYPIAPQGFGGFEVSGWVMQGEPPRQAFPVRMLNAVDIIGIKDRGTENKPVLRIDEVAFGPYPWDDVDQAEYITAADACKVQSLRLDGTDLFQSKTDPSKNATGIHGIDVTDFDIIDCEIDDLFNGACFRARAFVGSGQQVSRVSIEGGTISRSFPVIPLPLDGGHAGVFLVGPGIHDVSVTNTVFSMNHDAIDLCGDVLGPFETMATVNVQGCSFVENENGLEIVGEGEVVVDVDACVFDGNRNLANGTPFGKTPEAIGLSTAAIAVRGMKPEITVRNCVFVNNAYGVLWWTTRLDGVLDLGNPMTPGQNEFLPFDFGGFPLGTDPFRVQLYHRGPTGSSFDVFAVGNTWIPNNQGADAQGCLGVGTITAPADDNVNIVFTSGIPEGWPPGPWDGPGLDRNYSIKFLGNAIRFDTECAP